MFSSREEARYNRHFILPEVGKAGQERLKNASVLLIGAGGLGNPIAQYLCAAGVGTITLVDHDTVSESNLQRQILFNSQEIDQPKVLVAAQKLKRQNPFVTINTVQEAFGVDNALALVQAHDLVIDGSDNFATRYLINDATVICNKPWVYGSIYKFQGQVSVFNYKNGPTYRCLFPEPPEEGTVPSCSEIGVIGVLPGIIGTLQASEAIKIICGIGEPLTGKLFSIDTLSLATTTIAFGLDPKNLEIRDLKQNEYNCTVTPVPEISVDEAYEWLQTDTELQIIDIRPRQELENGTLPQAIHLPELTLETIGQLDRTKTTLVYCHYGNTSKPYVAQLQSQYQFTKVYNLTGGIDEWAKEIDNAILVY